MMTRTVCARFWIWLRYALAVLFAAQAWAAWWHPVPRWYVSFLCAAVAAFWVSMNVIQHALTRED